LQPHERRWVKFWRPAEPAPQTATELAIVPVDGDSAGQFADAVLAGFGMPPVLKPWLEALPGARALALLRGAGRRHGGGRGCEGASRPVATWTPLNKMK
jgi:hypothetical protein